MFSSPLERPGEVPLLLVWVLNKSLIFLIKSVHDSLIALFHLVLDILWATTCWHDRFMDGEFQGVSKGPIEILCAWFYVETSIDRQWNHRQLKVVGKHECTATEHAHVPRERAGALGKHYE